MLCRLCQSGHNVLLHNRNLGQHGSGTPEHSPKTSRSAPHDPGGISNIDHGWIGGNWNYEFH